MNDLQLINIKYYQNVIKEVLDELVISSRVVVLDPRTNIYNITTIYNMFDKHQEIIICKIFRSATQRGSAKNALSFLYIKFCVYKTFNIYMCDKIQKCKSNTLLYFSY